MADTSDMAIELDALQRDVLIPQIDAFLDATSDPAAREVYEALREAVAAMSIPAQLQARLGAIVEVALTSGRVRKLFGPGAELALNSLFMKTPRGREIAASIAELNQALGELRGQEIEHITTTQRSPGAYSLTIKTGKCQIVVRFEAAGVRVESLELDVGG
ncbi:MAG TPA: hypothetical protein VMA09_18205 [Candidatus Binataceae bacterium]|nr:hypothetical protein [Candidatus Binataceae bacterium]